MTRDQALAQLTAPGQAYELQSVSVAHREVKWFVQAPAHLRQLYQDAISDAVFLVYGQQRLSYREGWAQASAIGVAMVERFGITPGDRVAISMRNYPEWMLAYMAVTSIGAVAVAMNALWQPEEMAYALQDSGARLLVADQERLDRLQRSSRSDTVPVVLVRGLESKLKYVSDWTELASAFAGRDMPSAPIALDDIAQILYTSGSTGHPKGVPSSHRNTLAALLSWELDARAAELVAGGPAPVLPALATLLAVPLFHVTGLNAVFLSSFRAQRKIVSMYKWDLTQAVALIEQERITSVVAPAAMTGDLVRTATTTQHDLRSLLVVGGGGAPRAATQVKAIDETFANALPNTGWGMTETSAIGSGIGGEDYVAHPTSSGRCSAVLQLRVVDEQGRALAIGERGELQVRGTSVFLGYWNRPDANATAFDGDWFRTGDIACLDAEGYLYIVDRLKDLIIRGGENIGCGQVEAALLAHPLVTEASVYAVPDERLGEEVGATVFAAPSLDMNALREFLQGRLARFEVPRYLFTSATPLPRTPSGKILRRQIREAAIQSIRGGEQSPQWFTAALAHAPERRFVQYQGVELETLCWGDLGKPGLLLMHGNSAHADWYSFIAPHFAKEYRVVAFSFSGMGGSGRRAAYGHAVWAEEAMAVAEATGLFNGPVAPVFFAHSFGGFSLMNLCARFGERLRLAVIADTPLRTRAQQAAREEERPRRIKEHRVYATLEQAMGRFRLIPPQECANTFLVNHIARTSLEPVEDGSRAGEVEPGKSGWTWRFDPFLFRAFSMGKPGADLRESRCPVAWLNGENSSLVQEAVLENIRTYSPPGTEIVSLPDANHHLMLDQPLAFVEALRALISPALSSRGE
jgi:long-chain acyl-CoA synthetase